MVVAHASVSGNCNLLISEPRLPLAKNTTSCLLSGTALANLARYGLVWIALRPTLLLSNFTKNYNAHARFPHKKWPPVRIAVIGGNAGSLQRSGFRENPTNILTFVAR